MLEDPPLCVLMSDPEMTQFGHFRYTEAGSSTTIKARTQPVGNRPYLFREGARTLTRGLLLNPSISTPTTDACFSVCDHNNHQDRGVCIPLNNYLSLLWRQDPAVLGWQILPEAGPLIRLRHNQNIRYHRVPEV